MDQLCYNTQEINLAGVLLEAKDKAFGILREDRTLPVFKMVVVVNEFIEAISPYFWQNFWVDNQAIKAAIYSEEFRRIMDSSPGWDIPGEFHNRTSEEIYQYIKNIFKYIEDQYPKKHSPGYFDGLYQDFWKELLTTVNKLKSVPGVYGKTIPKLKITFDPSPFIDKGNWSVGNDVKKALFQRESNEDIIQKVASIQKEKKEYILVEKEKEVKTSTDKKSAPEPKRARIFKKSTASKIKHIGARLYQGISEEHADEDFRVIAEIAEDASRLMQAMQINCDIKIGSLRHELFTKKGKVRQNTNLKELLEFLSAVKHYDPDTEWILDESRDAYNNWMYNGGSRTTVLFKSPKIKITFDAKTYEVTLRERKHGKSSQKKYSYCVGRKMITGTSDL